MARRVKAREPVMRARYLLAAARRLTQGLLDGRFQDALKPEQNYLRAHVRAGRKRLAAAEALDEVARREGPFLVWRTRNDDRVDPACRLLEGTVFSIDNPPALPGAVHPYCRCYATAAPTGGLFPRVA